MPGQSQKEQTQTLLTTAVDSVFKDVQLSLIAGGRREVLHYVGDDRLDVS